jgi:hypothetical protein
MQNRKTKQTWSAVAQALNVSRRTILDWRKLSGAPAEPSIEAWQAYREETGLAPGKVSAEREKLLCDFLREKIRDLEGRNAEREHRTVGVEAVNTLFAHVVSLQKALLYRELGTELPPRMAGLGQPEMGLEGRKTAGRICLIMQEMEVPWNQNR